MKTKFKRIGKQSLSVILAVMMMVSTMLVGMVTSNAADTFTSGTTLYLKVSAITKGDERWAAYFYGNSLTQTWRDMTQVTGDTDYYKVTVPDNFANVIFCRMNGSKTENIWDNKWDQTGDLTASGAGTNNCFEISSSSDRKIYGSWTTYNGGSTATRNVTVSAPNTNYSVKVDGNDVTSVAEGGTYTFTVAPISGYKITGVTVAGATQTVSNPTGSNEYTLTMGDSDVTINVTTESTASWVIHHHFNSSSTNWDTVSLTVTNNVATYTYNFTNTGTYEFGFKEGDSNWYAASDSNEIAETNTTKTLTKNNPQNVKLKVSKTGTYTFKFNTSTKVLTVEYPSSTKYSVNIATGITGGTVSADATSLAEGGIFTVTATPAEGYAVESVTVTDSSSNPVSPVSGYTYTMPASNVTVTATFKKQSYNLSFTAPTGDGVQGVQSSNITPSAGSVEYGTTVSVTVTVNEGYTASLNVDGATVTTTKTGNLYTFSFTMPAQDVTVAPQVSKVATPAKNVVYLKNNAGWSYPNAHIWYDGGSDITGGWPGKSMTLFDVTNKIYAYELPDDIDTTKIIKCIFNNGSNKQTDISTLYDQVSDGKVNNFGKAYNNSNGNWDNYTPPKQYSVNVTTDDNATVTVNDKELRNGESTAVVEGSTMTIAINTTSEEYTVDTVTFNGVAQTVGSSYTIDNVSNNYNINVTTKQADGCYVYFGLKKFDNWNNVYAYMWKDTNNNTWPGKKLTNIVNSNYSYKSNTYSIYKVFVPVNYDKIQFSDGVYETDKKLDDQNVAANHLYLYGTGDIGEYTLPTPYLMYAEMKDTITDDNGSNNTVQKDITVNETDGTYSVTLTDTKYFNANNWFAFTTNQTTPNSAIVSTGTKPTVTNNSADIISEAKAEDKDSKYAILVQFKDRSLVQSLTISYKNNAYTVSATEREIPQDMVYLYAAKGTQGGNQFADSVVVVDGITENYDFTKSTDGNYQKFSAKQGDKVTVQYTMKTDYANAGYYIYALVVDGKKVDVTKSADGVYQSAPIDLTKEKTEVTPVYYNSVIDANNDYITVYATAPQDITTLWGNTLAIYTWFSSDDNNPRRGDGSYPGQAMMQESNGKYVAKVAKYYYYYDSTNKKVVKEDESNGGILIKGLLLNNFAESQSSRKSHFLTTPDQKTNNQTYDYDDFVKIAAMGYDTVQFDIKYESVTSSNQYKVISNATDAPDKSGTTVPTPATTYEDLTNIDGKLVSILGYDDATIRTKQGEGSTGLITDKSIQIISVGNQNIYVNDNSAWSTTSGSTQNVWSTIWYVYDTNGKFVTRGLPSDFIPRGSIVDGEFEEAALSEQTAAYQAIVAADLQYTSADISYETRMDADTSVVKKGNNNGVRVDGRWYYARSADLVDVEVGIIYKNSEGSYTTDITDNDITKAPFAGKITGASASISYTDSVGGEHSQIAKDSVERNTTVKFTADNSTTYEFIGWSTVPNPTDADIISKDANAISISTATKLYAVYEPYATGTLVLNHSKYNGSGANGGVGTYYIKAEVYNSSNTLVETFGGSSTEGPITIPAAYIAENSTYKIKVTLYTKPSANSTFVSFYGYENNDFNTVIGSTTNNGTDALFESITYEIEPAKLFTNGTQTVMAVNYFTDLKLPVLASEITFNYKPYSQAPVLSVSDPAKGNGTGTTTFTLTITKDGESTPAFEITNPVSSLTLSASSNISSIISDYINSNDVDYTVTITLNPQAGSRSYLGKTYLQGTDAYEEKSDGSVTSITVTHKLSDLYDKTNRKFKSDTVNYYTDFTADEYTFNATFEYLGYDSRKYFDEYGYGTSLPETEENAYKKTYTVNKTIIGADIDRYLTKVDATTYKLTSQFLIDYAPYEDNFVQTIKWDLANATVSFADSTVTAKITATYNTEQFIVTVKYPDNYTETATNSYTVDYAELVTAEDNEEEFLIKALDSYVVDDTTYKFSYWQITNDDGQEVAKCFNTEFNYRVYDHYTVEAMYNMGVYSRPDDERYTTIQFLEYSRNQFDKDGNTAVKSDKVYADFAIAYYYDRLQIRNDKSDLEVGVVFAIDRTTSSAKPESGDNNVSVSTIISYINGTADSAVPENQSIIKKTFDKTALDNKNRVEFSWNISNTENNQKLNLVAYSYIYNKEDGTVILSDGQKFKFYDVGNKTYNS